MLIARAVEMSCPDSTPSAKWVCDLAAFFKGMHTVEGKDWVEARAKRVKIVPQPLGMLGHSIDDGSERCFRPGPCWDWRNAFALTCRPIAALFSAMPDLLQVTEIQAELLGNNGIATEKIKHADLASFTCLKSFAFDQRFERKDAHDLISCIENAPEGIEDVTAAFRKELAGTHSAVIHGFSRNSAQ